jgi:penicillin-binding protein 2
MTKRIRLGFGFGESMVAESRRPRASTEFEDESVAEGNIRSIRILKIILIICFGIILARSFWLTVVKGSEYRQIADQNRIREEILRAPRSLILDRRGEKLTTNVPIFRVARNDKAGNITGYDTISRDEALYRESNGLPLLTEPGRSYVLGSVTAHVLGYVSEVGPQDLADGHCKGQETTLMLGDFVGRGGLEEQYDCMLRGVNGRRILETDTVGRTVRVLGEQQPKMGRDLATSLDIRLQRVASDTLGGRDGAVVVMEATSGAILAMVSSPSFNAEEVSNLLTSASAPLLNRALGGEYPAGSIYKMVVASAALSEEKISPTFTIDDPGVITAGGLKFSNWYFSEYGRREGVVDVVRAITRSTDTFFYEVGALTGPEIIADWARKYGFGKLTGVDIPGEVAGLVPTPEWKLAVKGEQWYLGNTYNISIGQGDVLVTPMQIAQMTQTIANGGRLCRPKVASFLPDECHSIGISEEVLRLIINGMVGACSPGGTAFPLFNFKPQVACKTGTAQFGIEGKLTHAWLTAFAPAKKPEIVVTALVEGGGEGSAIAAPVAKAVLEEWFKNK